MRVVLRACLSLLLSAGSVYAAGEGALAVATNGVPAAAGSRPLPGFFPFFDMSGLIQYNGTRYSKMSPVSVRLRGGGGLVFGESLSVVVRGYVSGGRRMLHGDPGAFAAVNDIAMFGTHTNDSLENLNRPQPHIDQAAVRFGGESVLVSVGLHDLASFLPDGSGIGGEPLSGEGMHGFLSTHFSRQLALPFLELERSLSIPAVLVRWRITTALVLKGGLTFGDVGYHVFIRNSLPLELEFRHRVFGREGRLAVYLGGADADASGTHRISPAGGLAVSQHLSGGLAVFASYCRAEAANPVSVLFGSFRWHGKAGVVAGDLSTDGNGWRAGVGFSAARHYTAPVPEKAVEVFWRLPLGPGMHLTPNLLLLVNPAGIEESGRTLALLAGLRYVLSY